VEKIPGVTDGDEKIRFESIISFPFFLLHTLKVLVADKNIEPDNLVPALLDDKKLTDTFDKIIKEGMIKGKKISENKEAFSFNFIKCLLKCRFLFDKYIIKREFVNENDGEWSLKELKMSSQKANYVNTYFGRSGEWETTWTPRNKINLMLQSCLRVSYTSPKVMHWITELLKWLYFDENLYKLNEYNWQIESIAANAVKNGYLKNGFYNLGTDTPHIVFNYLDYLLWNNDQTKYKDFVFEFRNTVEHWYPLNPTIETFEHWSHEDGVNDFGNLCIIQRNINSKFSNEVDTSKTSSMAVFIKLPANLSLVPKLILTFLFGF